MQLNKPLHFSTPLLRVSRFRPTTLAPEGDQDSSSKAQGDEGLDVSATDVLVGPIAVHAVPGERLGGKVVYTATAASHGGGISHHRAVAACFCRFLALPYHP
jgi:hypothetical protein